MVTIPISSSMYHTVVANVQHVQSADGQTLQVRSHSFFGQSRTGHGRKPSGVKHMWMAAVACSNRVCACANLRVCAFTNKVWLVSLVLGLGGGGESGVVI